MIEKIVRALYKNKLNVTGKGVCFTERDVYSALEYMEKEYEKKLKEYDGALLISKEKRLEGAKQTKLNERQIGEIYTRYSEDGESVSRLAREYGVSRGTILNYIKRSRTGAQEDVVELIDLSSLEGGMDVAFDLGELPDDSEDVSKSDSDVKAKISGSIEKIN